MQPSGESWFPQLSTFSQTQQNLFAYNLLALSASSYTWPPVNWGKKPRPLSLHFLLVGWDLFWYSRCLCWWFRHKQMQKISYPPCKESCSNISLGLTTMLSSWWEDPFHVWQRGDRGSGRWQEAYMEIVNGKILCLFFSSYLVCISAHFLKEGNIEREEII